MSTSSTVWWHTVHVMVVVSAMARETAFLRLTQKESLRGSGLPGSVEKVARVDFLHLIFFF